MVAILAPPVQEAVGMAVAIAAAIRRVATVDHHAVPAALVAEAAIESSEDYVTPSSSFAAKASSAMADILSVK